MLARQAGLRSIVAPCPPLSTLPCTPLPTAFPDFGLTPEQRREAVLGHYYEHPGMDGERGEIWCYTDRFSYRAGETVTLHVSATAESFRLEIVRDGGAETPVFEIDGIDRALAGHARPMLGRGLRLGRHASNSASATDWPSGAYRITLTAEGRDGKPIRCHHLFIVRPAARQEARPHPAGRGDRHLDWPTTPGAAPTTIRASPARTATSIAPTVSIERPLVPRLRACCRRRRRACRWRSRCRR